MNGCGYEWMRNEGMRKGGIKIKCKPKTTTCWWLQPSTPSPPLAHSLPRTLEYRVTIVCTSKLHAQINRLNRTFVFSSGLDECSAYTNSLSLLLKLQIYKKWMNGGMSYCYVLCLSVRGRVYVLCVCAAVGVL